MPKSKTFIEELSSLMDKYDAHFVVEDENELEFWLVQNDWEPVEIDFEWKTGKITASTIRHTRL